MVHLFKLYVYFPKVILLIEITLKFVPGINQY